MKTVLLVFGTRPEAIKMAPLVLEFARHTSHFKCITCVTAQHRQMLDQVLNLFDIHPDFDLNIMQPGQSLYDVTLLVLAGMRKVMAECRPDVVLVQGDTTTSFAAALAAFYERIPVAHVEAGLRTFDRYSPFPEEINRQLTTRLAHWHFAPTKRNRDNLTREGIDPTSIFVSGNTVIDALYSVRKIIYGDPLVQADMLNTIRRSGYQIATRRFILVTGHRRESFGEGFLGICEALKRIAIAEPDIDIVYPVHLNPNVRQPVLKLLSQTSNIYLTEPIDYQPFVFLMNESFLVLTDSGGIQEEAPSLGKPVLVMRSNTERPEAIEAGSVILVGTDANEIVSQTLDLVRNARRYETMAQIVNPYGDGNASSRIVQVLG